MINFWENKVEGKLTGRVRLKQGSAWAVPIKNFEMLGTATYYLAGTEKILEVW